jgi:hypothetical protein
MGSAIGNLFFSVLYLVMAIVIITNVLVPQFKDANTSGWDTAEVAIWGLGSLICIAAAVYNAARALGMGA